MRLLWPMAEITGSNGKQGYSKVYKVISSDKFEKKMCFGQQQQ